MKNLTYFVLAAIFTGTAPVFAANTDPIVPTPQVSAVPDTNKLNSDVSTVNAQELKQLAKTYKTYLAGYDSDVRSLKTNYGKLESDNQMLNQEYAKLKDEFDTYKDEQDRKSLYMIIGGLIIGGIAIIAK